LRLLRIRYLDLKRHEYGSEIDEIDGWWRLPGPRRGQGWWSVSRWRTAFRLNLVVLEASGPEVRKTEAFVGGLTGCATFARVPGAGQDERLAPGTGARASSRSA
jgi:hypothetical protein